MTVTYVNSTWVNSNTVTLPSGWQPGDLAIVIAYASSGFPALGSGWQSVTSTANGNVGWRVLQSGDTSTGTWTNATQLGVAVYRGALPLRPNGFSGVLVTTGTSAVTSTPTEYGGYTSSNKQVFLALMGASISSVTGSGWTERTASTQFAVVDADAYGSGATVNIGSSATNTRVTLSIHAADGFPIIADADTTTGTVTSNSTDWTLTYPSNIAAGDLLLAFLVSDGTQTTGTWPGGWVVLEGYVGATAVELLQAKKLATGSESGTFGVTLSNSEQGSWVVYRIPAGTWEGTLGANWSSGPTSQSKHTETADDPDANPNPPSLNPSTWDVEDTLWLAVVGVDTSRTVTDYSNWTSAGFFAYADYISGGSNGATLAVARLETPLPIVQDATNVNLNISGSTAERRWAQSLVAKSSVITGGSYYIQKVGSPTDNLIVELQTDSSGSPSGSVVATINTHAGASLTTSYVKYTWTSSVSVTSGSTYWIVFRQSGTPSLVDYFQVAAYDPGGYPDGQLKQWQSSTWVSYATRDLRFSVSFGAFASVDPGTITISSSDDWVAATIAIRPAAQPAGGSGSFTADAVTKKTQQGSFTASAVIKKTITDHEFLLVEQASAAEIWPAIYGGTGTYEELAQSFQSPVATNLARAEFRRNSSGSPTDDLTVKLTSTLGGSAIASETVASSVWKTGTWASVPFGATPALSVETTYYLEVSRSGGRDVSNYYGWWESNTAGSDLYPDGLDYKKDNGSWADISGNGDFGFRVYGLRSGFTADAVILATVDKYAVVTQDTGTSSWQVFGGTGTFEQLAQSFSLASTASVAGATLRLEANQNPADNFIIDFVDDRDGAAIASDSIAAASVSTSGSYHIFSFTPPPLANASTTYYLRASRSGGRDATNYVAWRHASDNPYANGLAAARANSVWNESTGLVDFQFILWAATAFTADAYIAGAVTGDFTADAVLLDTQQDSFAANAVIKDTRVFGPGGGATLIQEGYAGTAGSDINGTSFDVGSGAWDDVWWYLSTNTMPSPKHSGDGRGTFDGVGVPSATGWEGHAAGTTEFGDVDLYLTVDDANYYDDEGVFDYGPKAAGVWFRGTDATNRYCYLAVASGVPYTDATVKLYRKSVANGTVGLTLIASATGAWTSGDERIRAQVSGDSPTTLRLKGWNAGSAEPGTWHIDTTDNTAVNQTSQGVVGQANYGTWGTDQRFEVWWDDFLVTSSGTPTDGPGLTADAYFMGGFVGSFDADAVLLATTSDSISADAVTRKTIESSAVADAVFLAQAQDSISADAVILSTKSSDFTADSTIFRTTELGFTADADISPGLTTVPGDFTADAVIKAAIQGSATADAILLATSGESVSADAVLLATSADSIDADAVVLATEQGSITADSVVFATTELSFSAASFVVATVSDSFAADAAFDPVWFNWSETWSNNVGQVEGSLTADALLVATVGDSFSADAVLVATLSDSFSSDAIIERTWTDSFAADSVILATGSSSFSADAVVFATATESLFADAAIWANVAGSFSADATLKRTWPSDIAADAVFLRSSSGSITADAILLAAQAGSITADAVVLTSTSGQFDQDAVLQATLAWAVSADATFAATSSFSITASAVFEATSSGSVVADATFFAVGSGTITADAVVQRTATASFAADAVIFASSSGAISAESVFLATTELAIFADATLAFRGFAADAYFVGTGAGAILADATLFASIEGSFSSDSTFLETTEDSFTTDATLLLSSVDSVFADAVFFAVSSEAVSADAVLLSVFAGSLTADATFFASVPGSLSADAVLLAEAAGSLTADASFVKTLESSVTADAVVKLTSSGLLVADAIIQRSAQDSLTTDAIVLRPQPGSLAADAGIDPIWLDWSETWSNVVGQVAETVTADAIILAASIGSVTADAVVLATGAGTLAADAVIRATQSATFTSDSVFLKSSSAAIAADAVLGSTTSDSLSADAYIAQRSITADAYIVGAGMGSFLADATLFATVPGSATADAVIQATTTGDISADASIQQTGTGAFLANAVLQTTAQASVQASAWLAPAAGSFTADAYLSSSGAGAFTAEAVILGQKSASITSDSVLRAEFSGTFSTDAFILRPETGSVTFDAVLKGTEYGSITADAVIASGRTDGLTADSVIRSLQTGAFTADANIAGLFQSITADAVILATASGSFDADALVSVAHLDNIVGSISANTISGSLSVATISATLSASTISASISTDVIAADIVVVTMEAGLSVVE